MVNLLIHWVLNALALYIVARILPGFHLSDFSSALVAAIIIGLVNALIRPILLLLTLPISILTLGLFALVINALMLLLASAISPGFKIDGFWWAFLGSILLSLVSTILHSLVY